MIPPIFGPHAVHAPPQLASWLTLALSAGAVNAIAFGACARFVTHVTGIVTQVGLGSEQLVLVGEYLLVLGAFVLGAALSVAVSDGRRWRGLEPRPALPLALVAAILACAGIAGEIGAFGAFGGTVEQPPDFALLAALALAMGLQNASVAIATGMLVRTTHMTGPATDLGISLGTLLHAVPAGVRESATRSAVLRGGKIAAFALGAALGLVLAGVLGYAAFLAPALAIAAVAGTTFATADASAGADAAR